MSLIQGHSGFNFLNFLLFVNFDLQYIKTIHTVPKKYRKERMEAEMKQLELDIEMIEKNDEIYIAEDF